MKIKLYSINPFENRYRFYFLDDRDRDLFYPYTLTIRWGRIHCKGSKKTLVFRNQTEKDKMIVKLLTLRQRHGYKREE